MNNIKVLVIDDDIYINRMVEQLFLDEGASVICAQDGIEGYNSYITYQPDLVILDIMMAVMDGFKTCKKIRENSDTPILMLTSLDSDEQIIKGLDSGADDFITKPFKSKVLLARSRAVLRRTIKGRKVSVASSHYSDNYLKVDSALRLVQIEGDDIKVTPTEFNLLSYLIQNAGAVCESQKILENVWGNGYQDSIGYVHVYISHLRTKIEQHPQNPEYIHTVHGIGYRFEKHPG